MLPILLSLLLFLFATPVHAVYDPNSVPNNRYGIHIVETKDLPELGTLINSGGGDWGYVTMVLSDNDRDHGRWQTIFNQMRRLHLIPIIRLATHTEGQNWVKPQKDRFYEIVKLLNSLNWPTANRYVVLYNEPNHANEWGGTTDPEDYAETFVEFAQQLHTANEDFFILPAGLDASSGNDGTAMDEIQFLQRMIAAKPEILSLMDGWTSHSYPNPGFSGSPYARGRGTLSTFDWELSFLTTLGLTKELPVFITETGWEHAEGKSIIPSLLSSDQVGSYMQTASGSVWTDPRIAAITPFIYNYQDVPFDHFSWRRMGDNGYYPQYGAYLSIEKVRGEPKQHESYTLKSDLIPPKLIAGSSYTLSAMIENTGQGILAGDDRYAITLTSDDRHPDVFVDPLPYLEPQEQGRVTVHIQTPLQTGTMTLALSLTHNDTVIPLQTRTIELVPPPSVTIRAHLGWRARSDATGVSVLVYDNDTLLQKFTGLTMKGGEVVADRLTTIIPGAPYRVVTLVPGYLPRQVIGALGAGDTTVYPFRFLPLDFNGDGTFTAADLKTLVTMAPWTAILRFFGP